MRILTLTDLHQNPVHFATLTRVCSEQAIDVVCLVGDFLDLGEARENLLSTEEVIACLAALPVKHLLFVRGNHEENNWYEFVEKWPHAMRPLIMLHGTSHVCDGLTIIGFPCNMGDSQPWLDTLPETGNITTGDFPQKRKSFSSYEEWLPKLLLQTGSAGRTLWLMHQPPVTKGLCHPLEFDVDWTDAVERYKPLLVISGHSHEVPLINNQWYVNHEGTICVNAGQDTKTKYCIIEVALANIPNVLPIAMSITQFPEKQTIQIISKASLKNQK